jgi:hypothetical protein
MNILCENLLETYNANYLLEATPEERKILEEASGDYYGTDKGNQTLMKLILNKNRTAKPVADFISGPFTLSLHTNRELQMSVYNFGETHGTENICQPQTRTTEIHKYLEELTSNTDAFIDLFIELRPVTVKRYSNIYGVGPNFSEYNKYLYELHNTFLPCMLRERKRKCNLVRVHWIDDRELNYKNSDITSFRIWFCRYYPSQNKQNRIRDLQDFIPMIKQLTSVNESVYDEFFVGQLKKFADQSKSIKQSYKSEEIISFMTETILRYAHAGRSKIRNNAIRILKNMYDESAVMALCDDLVGVSSVFADMYTLSRMFKDFKGPVENSPPRPHNIIFYGGNAHADTYRRFLEHEKFNERKTIEMRNKQKKEIRCLNMSGFPQPFFQSLP